MQDYQRFFDGLAPRLETARTLERELDTQLARRFNVFDYLRTDELGLSRVIADLLDPNGKHGQGNTFLRLLLDRLECSDASKDLDHANVEVEVEKAIKDNRRFDICVRIGEHCLAIENKPYAGDQPNQIKDYLGWLKDRRFKTSRLIYLPPQGEPPSPESVKLTHLEAGLHKNHSFKVMPYHKGQGDSWDDDFDNYRLDYTLAEWLADCRKNCDVDKISWFLRETETFCERTFGGHTVASNKIKTIDDFLLSDEKNWDTALTVFKSLPQVRKDVCLNFMEMIFNAPSPYEYPNDLLWSWDFTEKRGRTICYVKMFKESWRPYEASGERTEIRIEADDRAGPNSWFIGIRFGNGRVNEDERERLQQLETRLAILGEVPKSWPGWHWWQWVDERYQDWDHLIPTLARECKKRTKIKRYFAERLAEVAKVAIPIIDEIEGS